MTDTLDQTQADFWREVRPDSVIKLTDETALAQSLESGDGLEGEEYFVRSVYQIEETTDLAEWLFFHLENDENNLYLLVTLVRGCEPEFGIYFEAGDWVSCMREEAAAEDQSFIFINTELDDPLDFEYTKHFEYGILDDDDVIDVGYDLSSPYPLQAMASRNPPEDPRMLTTIALYKSDNTDIHSPLAMIVEMGAPDNEKGGLVNLYLGSSIRANEMLVLRV